MAIIKSGNSANQLTVDASGAARVGLYDPTTGTPMVSFLRGVGKNFDTNSGGSDTRDVLGIGVPGPGGAVIAGTATTPLRTDPTGTTTQPISGTVAVSNHPASQAVTGTVAVSNLPTTQAVSGTIAVNNLPATQQVSGSVAVTNQPTSLAVSNFPASQTISGTVNAALRVGGADVGAGNPVPITGQLNVASSAASPVTVVSVDPALGASYCAVFDVVPTTVTAGTVFFSLRNSGSKVIAIRRLDIQQGFTGTAAASRSSFEFIRFNGTPTGGTGVTVVKKDSGAATSGAAVLAAPAGLTTTGVTFEAGALHRQTSANQLAAVSTQDVDFGDRLDGWLALQPGEGLAIRASGAVVAGAFMTGSLGWREV